MELFSSKDLRVEYINQKVKKGNRLAEDKEKAFLFLVAIEAPVLLKNNTSSSFPLTAGAGSCSLVYTAPETLVWQTGGKAELFLIRVTKSCLFDWMRQENEVYQQLQGLVKQEGALPQKPVEVSVQAREQLFAMTFETEYIQPVTDLLSFSRCCSAVAYLVHDVTKPTDENELSDKERQIAVAAKNYLDQMPDRVNYTIITLAKELGTNETTLKIAFKKLTGTTIHKYYHQKRMEKAEVYLKAGKSITETSRLIGYRQVSHFSYIFKQQYGIPPTKIYR